jgi:hypothetical protein
VVRHQRKSDEDLLKCAPTILLVLVLAAYVSIAGADRASAEPVKCPSGHVWNPQAVTCVLTVTSPRPETTDPGRSRHPGSQPAKSQSKKCVSSYSGKEVPCKEGSSWWSNDRDCYVSLANPQPPKSDPQWEGHTTGAIYECYSPALVGTRMYLLVCDFSGGPGGAARPAGPRVAGDSDHATAGDRDRNRAGGSARQCRDRWAAHVDVGRGSRPAYVGADYSNRLNR